MNCNGCGEPLKVENAWMVDGCPCNSPEGCNSTNETRWRMLHELQQRQSHELHDATAALTAAREQAAQSAAELERVRKDAERYRWLRIMASMTDRDNEWTVAKHLGGVAFRYRQFDLDSAIDQASREGK